MAELVIAREIQSREIILDENARLAEDPKFVEFHQKNHDILLGVFARCKP